jgi:hypothetical protein
MQGVDSGRSISWPIVVPARPGDAVERFVLHAQDRADSPVLTG